MIRKRTHRRARGLATLLALLLSVQAIAWVSHAAEHGGWFASASGGAFGASGREAASAGSRALASGEGGDLIYADSRDEVHVHGGPFARCGACDALAQLQGAAPPTRIWLAPVRAVQPEFPDFAAIQAHRILARATARGPPRG